LSPLDHSIRCPECSGFVGKSKKTRAKCLVQLPPKGCRKKGPTFRFSGGPRGSAFRAFVSFENTFYFQPFFLTRHPLGGRVSRLWETLRGDFGAVKTGQKGEKTPGRTREEFVVLPPLWPDSGNRAAAISGVLALRKSGVSPNFCGMAIIRQKKTKIHGGRTLQFEVPDGNRIR